MRKIVAHPIAAVAAALLLAGCRSAGSGGSAGGAPSPTGAVQEFLAAAHSGDVRTMASLFGTSNGSISRRDRPNDVEKRMRTLQCYLTHDSARVFEDAPGLGAGRQVGVQLTQGPLVRRTAFSTVQGPHGRWYVEAFDISAVTDLCHP